MTHNEYMSERRKKMPQLNIEVPAQLKEDIKKAAEIKGVPATQLIRTAIADYIRPVLGGGQE